jgi:anti-anti-sigma regulatory factor
LIEHAADDGDQDTASRFAEARSDEMVHSDVHKAVVIKLNQVSYG